MGSITEVNTNSHVKTKPDLENGLALGYRSETLCNFRCVMASRLYRTARVDAASLDDIQRLEESGIRTIIDLRSSNEAKALGLDGKSFQNPFNDRKYKKVDINIYIVHHFQDNNQNYIYRS